MDGLEQSGARVLMPMNRTVCDHGSYRVFMYLRVSVAPCGSLWLSEVPLPVNKFRALTLPILLSPPTVERWGERERVGVTVG